MKRGQKALAILAQSSLWSYGGAPSCNQHHPWQAIAFCVLAFRPIFGMSLVARKKSNAELMQRLAKCGLCDRTSTFYISRKAINTCEFVKYEWIRLNECMLRHISRSPILTSSIVFGPTRSDRDLFSDGFARGTNCWDFHTIEKHIGFM